MTPQNWTLLILTLFGTIQTCFGAWIAYKQHINTGSIDQVHRAVNSSSIAATKAAKDASDMVLELATKAATLAAEAAFERGRAAGQGNLADATERAFNHGRESWMGMEPGRPNQAEVRSSPEPT